MATARAPLTPTANTARAVVRIPAGEPSGSVWVGRFPGTESLNDLVSPFKENATSFIAALEAAGATVSIASTLRPPERAYMMHWSYQIRAGKADPQTIPPMTGVAIKWDHAPDGVYSETASVNGAKAMVDGFRIGHLKTPPALNTNHTTGNAIDMSISWSGDLVINKADGTAVTITSTPRTGMNADLKAVGASYGVIKFLGGDADKPHWSHNGR